MVIMVGADEAWSTLGFILYYQVLGDEHSVMVVRVVLVSE